MRVVMDSKLGVGTPKMFGYKAGIPSSNSRDFRHQPMDQDLFYEFGDKGWGMQSSPPTPESRLRLSCCRYQADSETLS